MEMKRGDVVICAVDYGKPRPAVVVQSDLFNDLHSSVVVCLITSHLKASALGRSDHTLLTKAGPAPRLTAGMITPSLPAACRQRQDASGGSFYLSKSGSFLVSAEAWKTRLCFAFPYPPGERPV